MSRRRGGTGLCRRAGGVECRALAGPSSRGRRDSAWEARRLRLRAFVCEHDGAFQQTAAESSLCACLSHEDCRKHGGKTKLGAQGRRGRPQEAVAVGGRRSERQSRSRSQLPARLCLSAYRRVALARWPALAAPSSRTPRCPTQLPRQLLHAETD